MAKRVRLLACAVVCATVAAPSPASATSAPASATLTDHGEALALPGRFPESMVPVWIDMDLDGQEEPVWFSSDGVIAVDESLTPHPVQMLGTVDLSAGRHDPVGCVLDVEGDGDRELLVVGSALYVFDVTAPYTLSARDVPSPSLPPATALDIACGDLNADGLPDAAVAFGIYSSERTENRGFPDYVLMNLGHGRFEVGPVEPSRDAFTQGLTLADMDLDGRPDLIESMDFSMIAGASRLLYNRTEPGARWPVFEVGEGTFDTGTCGMGAAVEDLDASGVVRGQLFGNVARAVGRAVIHDEDLEPVVLENPRYEQREVLGLI